MGHLLSNFFEWDGQKIIESTLYGLEDSNFHTEVREISKLTNIEI
jgi:hypothetical protein